MSCSVGQIIANAITVRLQTQQAPLRTLPLSPDKTYESAVATRSREARIFPRKSEGRIVLYKGTPHAPRCPLRFGARVQELSRRLVTICHNEVPYPQGYQQGCVAQSKDRILRKQLGTVDLLGGAEGDGG